MKKRFTIPQIELMFAYIRNRLYVPNILDNPKRDSTFYKRFNDSGITLSDVYDLYEKMMERTLLEYNAHFSQVPKRRDPRGRRKHLPQISFLPKPIIDGHLIFE